MSWVRWHKGASIGELPAAAPLAHALELIENGDVDWIVLSDEQLFDFYAYRPVELRAAAMRAGSSALLGEVIRSVLGGRPAVQILGQDVPPDVHAPARAVQIDVAGNVSGVGEIVAGGGASPGFFEGGNWAHRDARAGTDAAREAVDAILSARTPARAAVDAETPVDVRIELAEGASPYADRIAATMDPEEDVVIFLLTAPPGRVDVVGSRMAHVSPPSGAATGHQFVVRARSEGVATVDVLFSQGGSDLGTIHLEFEVAATIAPDQPLTGGSTRAAPRSREDDDVVVLLVDEGPQLSYRFWVSSAALGMQFEQFDTRPFAGAAGPLEYVKTVYRRLEERALRNAADLALFEREVRGVGVEMSDQLLPKDLAERLWDARDRISLIQVNSREPYVPWELLRLRDPRTRDVDERHFAEYALVRSLTGRRGADLLPRTVWRYVVGAYPAGSHAPIGAEGSFLREELPRRGLSATDVEPRPSALLDTLAHGDFDVLHIACHATATLDDATASRLILADEATRAEPLVHGVDVSTVDAEANFGTREPLIFLNACQSARQAPLLTDWGGWARTFWAAGAGAFVGTSWSVREQPAKAFATSFYDALLDGRPLAQAASEARTTAKRAGDASWLAYAVYGDPTARMQVAPIVPGGT